VWHLHKCHAARWAASAALSAKTCAW
jgi:hypothetical protein